MKERTINNMTARAQSKARQLWDEFTSELQDEARFCRLRDEYHAMFKDSRNFVKGAA